MSDTDFSSLCNESLENEAKASNKEGGSKLSDILKCCYEIENQERQSSIAIKLAVLHIGIFVEHN